MSMFKIAAPTVNNPKMTMPTGYENQQAAIETKRKLAAAMLAQGLSPESNMTSWAQVLGHMAQAWAGKSLQKDADKAQEGLRGQMWDERTKATTELWNDVHSGMPIDQILQKYGNNPLVQEEIKPYQEAFASTLKNGEEVGMYGGQWRKKKDVPMGTIDQKPDSSVLIGPDGQAHVNGLKVDIGRSLNGFNVGEGQNADFRPSAGYSWGPNGPVFDGGAPAPAQAQAPQAPSGSPIDPEFLMRQARAVGSNPGVDPSLIGSSFPPPQGTGPNGEPAWLINGEWYDNPEGR